MMGFLVFGRLADGSNGTKARVTTYTNAAPTTAVAMGWDAMVSRRAAMMGMVKTTHTLAFCGALRRLWEWLDDAWMSLV